MSPGIRGIRAVAHYPESTKTEHTNFGSRVHNASDEDQEAASALLGLFGGISSDLGPIKDEVLDTSETRKRNRDDDWPCSEGPWSPRTNDAIKLTSLKRQVRELPVGSRGSEFVAKKEGSLQLQCIG